MLYSFYTSATQLNDLRGTCHYNPPQVLRIGNTFTSFEYCVVLSLTVTKPKVSTDMVHYLRSERSGILSLSTSGGKWMSKKTNKQGKGGLRSYH